MTTFLSSVTPQCLPVLDRGKHRDPTEGSCLMEYVSVLAGGRFSDHPRCTHPRLAWLARRVDDTVSDDARRCLVGLAPALIGTRVRGHGIGAVVYAELARAGLTAAPDHRGLRDLAELAASHLGPTPEPSMPWRRSPPRWLRQPVATADRGVAFAAVREAMSGLPGSVQDRLLVDALTRSVHRSRAAIGLSAVATHLSGTAGNPTSA
jgi:hypothetical protein